jgi:hypothetical protein
MYQAMIQRNGDKFTIDPWEEHITGTTAPGVSRYDRLKITDPVNEEPPPQMRLGGDIFRSVPANVKN